MTDAANDRLDALERRATKIEALIAGMNVPEGARIAAEGGSVADMAAKNMRLERVAKEAQVIDEMAKHLCDRIDAIRDDLAKAGFGNN